MLGYRGQHKPCIEQRLDCFRQRVLPLVGDVMGEPDRVVGVSGAVVKTDRLAGGDARRSTP